MKWWLACILVKPTWQQHVEQDVPTCSFQHVEWDVPTRGIGHRVCSSWQLCFSWYVSYWIFWEYLVSLCGIQDWQIRDSMLVFEDSTTFYIWRHFRKVLIEDLFSWRSFCRLCAASLLRIWNPIQSRIMLYIDWCIPSFRCRTYLCFVRVLESLFVSLSTIISIEEYDCFGL